MDEQQFIEMARLIAAAKQRFNLDWCNNPRSSEPPNDHVLASIRATCGPLEFTLTKDDYGFCPPVFSLTISSSDNGRGFYHKECETLEEVIQELDSWIQRAIAAMGAAIEP